MDGILVVDKPQGWTSHDVVDFVRKRFRIKKAGHAGILDPMATGVLVLLLGRYTKRSVEFMAAHKEYRAVLTLGEATDTQDATGKILSQQPVPRLKQADVEKVLKRFTGEIEQVPPMVSALKVRGQKLYKLAKQGVEIKRLARKIIIEKLELESFNPPNLSLHVVCSKGTYIRSLCADIAVCLGCVGHMSCLKRIRSGRFSIDDAVDVEKLKKMPLEGFKNVIRNP